MRLKQKADRETASKFGSQTHHSVGFGDKPDGQSFGFSFNNENNGNNNNTKSMYKFEDRGVDLTAQQPEEAQFLAQSQSQQQQDPNNSFGGLINRLMLIITI